MRQQSIEFYFCGHMAFFFSLSVRPVGLSIYLSVCLSITPLCFCLIASFTAWLGCVYCLLPYDPTLWQYVSGYLLACFFVFSVVCLSVFLCLPAGIGKEDFDLICIDAYSSPEAFLAAENSALAQARLQAFTGGFCVRPPSSPLLPNNNKTLLFSSSAGPTQAWMVQPWSCPTCIIEANFWIYLR